MKLFPALATNEETAEGKRDVEMLVNAGISVRFDR